MARPSSASTAPSRTLAVVDLGSNSFRLEIGRVEGDQIYRLDTWRETLRFGAGLDPQGRIKGSAMKSALECLARFRERLAGLHPSAGRGAGHHPPPGDKEGRGFPPKSRARARLPDRRDRRARGSAPDLSRCRAR